MKIIVNESQYHLIRRLDLIRRLLYGFLFDTERLKSILLTTNIDFRSFREEISRFSVLYIAGRIVGSDNFDETKVKNILKLRNELKSFILENFDGMFKEAYRNYTKKEPEF